MEKIFVNVPIIGRDIEKVKESAKDIFETAEIMLKKTDLEMVTALDGLTDVMPLDICKNVVNKVGTCDYFISCGWEFADCFEEYQMINCIAQVLVFKKRISVNIRDFKSFEDCERISNERYSIAREIAPVSNLTCETASTSVDCADGVCAIDFGEEVL